MRTKKIVATIMAVMLICAISVTGTLAFLQATTEKEVVNTFVAAGGGSLFEGEEGEDNDGDGIEAGVLLNESLAVRDAATGKYTLDTTNKVFANDYTVLPGTTVAKDPAISVNEKNDVPAYVYVEIVSKNANITFEVADGWVATGVTGPNGGTVYHLSNAIVADLAATPILKNNQINVADVEDLGLDANGTVTFYGYLAQSSVNDSTAPAEVFTTCFSK